MEEKPRKPQTLGGWAGTVCLGRVSHTLALRTSGPLLVCTRWPAGSTGWGYSRAGPRQLAEPTGRLPHQVHGPPVGGQREKHVVADLFVAEHLLLEERRRRRSLLPFQPPASRPKGSPGWRREWLSWPPQGLQAPHAPALEEGPLPSDDNCISLIISMQPGHGTSWDPSCCSNLRINDLGTEKHSEPWIDFQRREARGRCERASQAWEGKFNPERH